MPRFIVTQNMGAALKNLRIQRNVKAIDVAKSINKTGAYISKLEKGVLNTIEESDLIEIIHYLSDDEEQFNENIRQLLSDTTMKYSKEESQNEEWQLNLDLFHRFISVPKEYKTIVQKKIEELDLTISELTDYINSNSDLYNDERFSKELLDNAEKNHWYFNNGVSFIVVHVEEDTLQNIIYSEEKGATNYSMLLCILVSLFRLEKYSHDESYSNARKILNKLHIQTLSDKDAIMQAYDKRDQMHTILDQRNNENLPEEDRKLLTSLYEITRKINLFAQLHDIEYSNERLSVMLNNLTEDPILFMGYIGVDLSKLKNCDFQIKKEFVSAVKDLIEEYSIRKPTSPKEELI